MYFVCYSVWTLVAVVGVTFYEFKLIEHVIGAPVELPDYISNHSALTPLINNPNTKRPFDDNLCFFFGASPATNDSSGTGWNALR